jgi:acid phosphatase
MRGRFATICTIALGIATLGACFTPQVSLHRRNETLWASESAEYTAVALQTYEGAGKKLVEALADPSWTACLEQQEGYESLPPAIIVDLDETVLDNRPFQMRLFRENLAFDEARWNEWVREGRSDAIPGAVEFLLDAAERGVQVFYVTNRTHEVEPPTRKNLAKLGLPLDTEMDTVLTKNEQPDWGRDKTSRRLQVAESYRVLLLLGDDLDDFISSVSESRDSRQEAVVSKRAMWGEKWFVLPNPLYGGWVAPTLKGATSFK